MSPMASGTTQATGGRRSSMSEEEELQDVLQELQDVVDFKENGKKSFAGGDE